MSGLPSELEEEADDLLSFVKNTDGEQWLRCMRIPIHPREPSVTPLPLTQEEAERLTAYIEKMKVKDARLKEAWERVKARWKSRGRIYGKWFE